MSSSKVKEPPDTEDLTPTIEVGLSQFVKNKWDEFRRHRSKFDLQRQYLLALKTYNGEYTSEKKSEIAKFGGSDVFSRLTTVKCRGATAMLRDVFLGPRRPWDLEPTPEPTIPDAVAGNVAQLVQLEAQSMQMYGQPIDQATLQNRQRQLMDAARRATIKQAKEQANRAELKLDDILTEGGFYEALGEFLIDLPIFKFACIKGPVVQNRVNIQWQDGQLVTATTPQMFWNRVSPFDLYFSPGAASIKDADVIERCKVSRGELEALVDLPGYDSDAVKAALKDYDMGLVDWIDDSDSEEADETDRENPHQNDAQLIDMIEFHGRVQGRLLLEWGFKKSQIEDEIKEYTVSIWMVGRYIIKVQMNPNPLKRHPYYLTSYEKVPGSLYGHGLVEIIQDIQDVANASLRSLVNNMSIASGPQVMINEERLSPTTNANSLYPWKRWRYISDPMMADNQPPVSFFQPQSNAAELLGIYKSMMDMADEVSAIPRYITGSEKVSGAASTASGLSMLMGNASKVLQNVAGQIDNEVIKPLLEDLYTMVMLTDKTGTLRGDEKIVVKGVNVAIQKETDRMRKLEFLQITGNPLDQQIVGLQGRAALLRSLADDLGLPEETIVPSEDELQTKLEAAAQGAMMPPDGTDAAAQAQGAQAPMPGQGNGRMASQFDNMSRTGAK